MSHLASAPPAADTAHSLVSEIDAVAAKPLAVGIGGELQMRTEVLNAACDGKVFDPFARAPGCAALRIKRGPVTGFKAIRDNGALEAHEQPPDAKREIAAARGRAEAARGELAERLSAIERVDATMPKRPAWWQLWLWPLYWIGAWLSRRKQAERGLASLAVAEASQKLEAIEADTNALEAHARLARSRYVDALRNLSGGGPIGAGVIEIELTLAQAPLPDGVEMVELSGVSRAGADIDALFLAQDNRLHAPVRGGNALPIGEPAQVIPQLPSLLADARALRIARRVQLRIGGAIALLADVIERKESGFRTRIDRLQALRLVDPTGFASEQLESVRAEISASVNAVVEHASVHLGSELAALQNDWIGALSRAESPESLDAVVAKIANAWNGEPRRIAEEVRVLVTGGLGGAARDLYPTIVRGLRGLPEEDARIKAAPELPPVVLLPSLLKETAKLEKPGWFAGLFRSFDAKRTEIREKVHERLERMQEVASSELLDSEPRLNHAIAGALAALLETAIGKQQAWLDQALDEERRTIAEEREAIIPLVHVHDAVRTDANRLAEMVAELERAQPAIAVAAAAAETASLSR